jgi:hypothetical protein
LKNKEKKARETLHGISQGLVKLRTFNRKKSEMARESAAFPM